MIWDEALAEHYRTGDYRPLGIWAQDNVPRLIAERDDETTERRRLEDLVRVMTNRQFEMRDRLTELEHYLRRLGAPGEEQG